MIQSTTISSTSFASSALGVATRARLAAPAPSGSAALVDASGSPNSSNALNSAESRDVSSASTAKVGELTQQEQQQVAQLKQIDRMVRAHEQAHLAVGADLVRGGATFSYQVGPDHQRYAVSGEVSIDVSPASTPQETIPKAAHIRATALAPADPSAQDNSVAAQASRMEGEARMEIAAAQQQAASIEPGGVGFYRRTEESNSGPGGRLDLFA